MSILYSEFLVEKGIKTQINGNNYKLKSININLKITYNSVH